MQMHIPHLRKFLLLFLSLAFIGSVATADRQQVSEAVKQGGARQDTYYSIYPDRRRCIFPLCGGYWVSEVNNSYTRCFDGTLQEACYVAEINGSSIEDDRDVDPTLVLGSLHSRNYQKYGRFGVLVVEDAWRPATLTAPEGIWYGLKDSDIQCITTPCYSIDERVLNRKVTHKISGVDLSQVKADREDVEAAYDALLNDELIAVGENQVAKEAGPAGDGLVMVTTQFFLKLGSEPEDNLFCETVDDCTLTVYHSYVKSPEDCYCLLCPVPLNADAAFENERSWQLNCRDFGYSSADGKLPDELICPAVRCIAPQPVACVDNQCVFEKVEMLPLR
jgi:hypothetical protein